jgi:hypothetical protein
MEGFMTSKPTNPKDAVGVKKVPYSTVPGNVITEVAAAMAEGALKYGRHNYRGVGVRASVYYDATLRHLISWWEGEDIDPDSGLSHITKAITSMVVLRDAMLQGKCEDDRPPRSVPFMKEANAQVEHLLGVHAGRHPMKHWTIADSEPAAPECPKCNLSPCGATWCSLQPCGLGFPGSPPVTDHDMVRASVGREAGEYLPGDPWPRDLHKEPPGHFYAGCHDYDPDTNWT